MILLREVACVYYGGVDITDLWETKRDEEGREVWISRSNTKSSTQHRRALTLVIIEGFDHNKYGENEKEGTP